MVFFGLDEVFVLWGFMFCVLGVGKDFDGFVFILLCMVGSYCFFVNVFICYKWISLVVGDDIKCFLFIWFVYINLY